MVQITILYFGAIRDVTGAGSETATVPGTLKELEAMLHARYPQLSVLPYRYSVNEKLIGGNSELLEGDVIALLPPFAGG